ncbi:MAG TPA: 2-amino-4-hydroxy-6-hydroxymethyldihydropteridine diphosphokinase [Luteolibacter sp.]|nr:2-amino-4-hydroxy-6-hydroxymethyldihydropteridine diphosphokinase [Luteolibacter sp.]
MIRRCGIALGSNLGDSRQLLREAIALLRQIAVPGEMFLEAPVYRTPPLACPAGSPDFLNTVAELAWNGTPHELLEKTRAIEEQLGRTRGAERNAPRTIDLDLLYCGELQTADTDLTLPHPRIAERRFVLQPLADIRPRLVLPGMSFPVRVLLENLADAGPPPVPLD